MVYMTLKERERQDQIIDIKSNTDFAKSIQEKSLSDKWQTALTAEENQIISILYNSKTALNLREIRKSLIFSTVYHLIEKAKIMSKEDFKKYSRGFSITDTEDGGKREIFANKNIIESLNLDKYSSFPFFYFTNNQAADFLRIVSEEIYLVDQIYLKNDYEHLQKISKKLNEPEEFLKGRWEPHNQWDMLPSSMQNITNAEKIFSKVLSNLHISVYGFSTIKNILKNLNALNIVLTRKPISERVDVVYLLNPKVTEYFDNQLKQDHHPSK